MSELMNHGGYASATTFVEYLQVMIDVCIAAPTRTTGTVHASEWKADHDCGFKKSIKSLKNTMSKKIAVENEMHVDRKSIFIHLDNVP